MKETFAMKKRRFRWKRGVCNGKETFVRYDLEMTRRKHRRVLFGATPITHENKRAPSRCQSFCHRRKQEGKREMRERETSALSRGHNYCRQRERGKGKEASEISAPFP